jgi:hypothetical protein
MRKRKLLTVYPIPYSHLDANGRLAGATPVGENARADQTAVPNRLYIGATRVVLEHDTKGREPGSTRLPRTESMFVWTGEAEQVDGSGALEQYYRQLEQQGEVVIIKDGETQPPLEKLAAARDAAIAQFRAEQAHERDCPLVAKTAKTCDCIEDPSATEWPEQFPLDAEVAIAAQLLREQREANEAAAKSAAAKAKADAAEADKKTKPDAAEAEKKAKADAAELRKRIAEGLGIKPRVAAEQSKTTTSNDAGPAKES